MLPTINDIFPLHVSKKMEVTVDVSYSWVSIQKIGLSTLSHERLKIVFLRNVHTLLCMCFLMMSLLV